MISIQTIHRFLHSNMLTNNVSSVFPKHKDLHFNVGVAVSQQKEDEAEHLVNVTGSMASNQKFKIQDTHQMSTLLFNTLLCWWMFGLSQDVVNTLTPCPAMSKLVVILFRLAVSRVAEPLRTVVAYKKGDNM